MFCSIILKKYFQVKLYIKYEKNDKNSKIDFLYLKKFSIKK